MHGVISPKVDGLFYKASDYEGLIQLVSGAGSRWQLLFEHVARKTLFIRFKNWQKLPFAPVDWLLEAGLTSCVSCL